jgi:hypothetical protein
VKVPTTHDLARQWVTELTTDRPSWHRDLTAYVDAQEQSGREMMALADELNTAKEDRDAERTEKEVLRVELEKTKSARDTLSEALTRVVASHVKLTDTLRAESEELKSKLERSELLLSKARPLCGFVGKLHTESVLHPLVRGYVVDWMAALIEPAQKPAEAAPATVAAYCCHTCFRVCNGDLMLDRMILCSTCGNKRCPKANDHLNECSGSNEPGQPGAWAEAAPVAKAEASPEPAGWVPKVGDPVRVTAGDLAGQLGTIIDHDTGRTWPYGVVFIGDYIRRFVAESLEPRPKPPAAAGAVEKPAQAEQKDDALTQEMRDLGNPAGERVYFGAGHWGPVGLDVARCNWVSSAGGRCVGENAHTGPHRSAPKTDPTPPQLQGDGVTRKELIAALARLVNRGGIIAPNSPGSWFAKLAEELERKPQP